MFLLLKKNKQVLASYQQKKKKAKQTKRSVSGWRRTHNICFQAQTVTTVPHSHNIKINPKKGLIHNCVLDEIIIIR